MKHVEAVVAHADGHVGGQPFITRPKRSVEELRAELILAQPRLVVVGPAVGPAVAELLFAPRGPGGPPVALIPSMPTKITRPGPTRRLLTVGFHDSDTAVNALQWAVTEAERTDARVRAVVVWAEDQLGRLSGGVVISSHRCALPGQTAKRVGALALAQSGVPLDRVSSLVLRGSPAAVLVREAACSDLLVVGAAPAWVHNHPVLGTTVAGCVANTRVPIIVVPTA
jgi:nucleotide-binding universal stress UspA family protein